MLSAGCECRHDNSGAVSSDAHHARYGGENTREIFFHLIGVEAPVLKSILALRACTCGTSISLAGSKLTQGASCCQMARVRESAPTPIVRVKDGTALGWRCVENEDVPRQVCAVCREEGGEPRAALGVVALVEATTGPAHPTQVPSAADAWVGRGRPRRHRPDGRPDGGGW